MSESDRNSKISVQSQQFSVMYLFLNFDLFDYLSDMKGYFMLT